MSFSSKLTVHATACLLERIEFTPIKTYLLQFLGKNSNLPPSKAILFLQFPIVLVCLSFNIPSTTLRS